MERQIDHYVTILNGIWGTRNKFLNSNISTTWDIAYFVDRPREDVSFAKSVREENTAQVQ